VLLEQRNHEVDAEMHILCKIVGAHANVADSNGQAQDLLHLELDGGLDFINLSSHRFLVGEQTRELASLVQARTEQTGNLLDQGLGGKEGVVFLGCNKICIPLDIIRFAQGMIRSGIYFSYDNQHIEIKTIHAPKISSFN
jgi:hypothetical protein